MLPLTSSRGWGNWWELGSARRMAAQPPGGVAGRFLGLPLRPAERGSHQQLQVSWANPTAQSLNTVAVRWGSRLTCSPTFHRLWLGVMAQNCWPCCSSR